ncbi:hypothetical protein A2U01_0067414, partial [Trifolium medium]|nr:hypothetical protein [Trifolium medium]
GRKGKASAWSGILGCQWGFMKILSWNIRGLGGLEKRKELPPCGILLRFRCGRQ